jgi:2-polyprenyl-6-methoxyphenol hydroxylase-like FAD-dependent oxidoreductase
VIPELDEVVAQGTDAQKALLRQRFQDIGWQSKRFLDELGGSEDLYMQSIAMVINPKWTKGRCAIAGDSAFAIMGMGTSYAIIGGYTLAGELSKIESNSAADVAAALQNYESIVRPLVAAREKPPPFFPQTFNPQTQMGVTALRTMLRVAFGLRIPQIAQWALSGESKETWKLPDYGWEEPQADAETK